MVRTILALSLLALSLAAPGVEAQTAAPAAATPAANAVDPASIQALKDMGTYLQSLKRFQVMTEATGERVLADGQKLQHSATAWMDVERPNRIRAVMRSARSMREVVYDGSTVTLYTPAQNFYSTVAFTGTISELIGGGGAPFERFSRASSCRCRTSFSSERPRHRSTSSSLR